MFFTGETPWHGLGRSLDRAPSTAAAIKAAKLDWQVSLCPLQTSDGLKSDHRLAVRDSDLAVLGTVGPGYTVLQNSKAFEQFDPMVERGALTLETAGSLAGGRRVWILARVAGKTDTDRVSADDRVGRFVLLAHAHDGTLAVRAGVTLVRVVCANTLAAACSARDGGLATIRHTKSMTGRVETMFAALAATNAVVDETMERYRNMRKIPVRSQAAIDQYLGAVFGTAELARQEQAREKRTRSELSMTIERLTDVGRGTDLAGVRGTAWGLYNAVSEYLTHVQGRGKDPRVKAERRADRNAWGDGSRMLSRAMSDEVLAVLQGQANAESVATRGIPLSAVGFG